MFCDWGTMKDGNPQGSVLGRLLFIININDLTPRINSVSEATLFANDTSINFKQKFLFHVKFSSFYD